MTWRVNCVPGTGRHAGNCRGPSREARGVSGSFAWALRGQLQRYTSAVHGTARKPTTRTERHSRA